MSGDNEKTGDKTSGQIVKHGTSLLDAALADVSPSERARLTAIAIEKRIGIEADAAIARRKHDASGLEIDEGVRTIRDLEGATKNDFTFTGSYERASGQTTIRVSKANNTILIVVAVVIGVIFFAVFSR